MTTSAGADASTGATIAIVGRVAMWTGLAVVVVGLLWAAVYFLSQGAAPLSDFGPRNLLVGLTVSVAGLVILAAGLLMRWIGRRS
ncbi:cell division protein CrgA [Leifsonia sp. ZF2019]|uniref:cell division protein CrgA n=1 Tax=Leifsonia sp. ZF2019 TaxID=2781978 RepID=UPI001CBAD931|nr:cell division protein CrgA [Leifsonia sp. ZF2019]UAJ80140.1 cell division protein CrgA [Leifsonia sp. ZF2019]